MSALLATPNYGSFNLRIESLVIESFSHTLTHWNRTSCCFNLRIESLVIES